MIEGLSYRIDRVRALASRLEDPKVHEPLIRAYVADTAFLAADVRKREVWTP